MTKENPFQRTVGTKLQTDTLTVHQEARLKKFLDFDLPPNPTDSVDTIVVLGTSPFTDSMSFYMRVNATLNYSGRYPEATVVFTGSKPDDSRATNEEKLDTWVEALAMKEVTQRMGLPARDAETETESRNLRENVVNTLKLLEPRLRDKSLTSILFITSSYSARRLDFYTMRLLEEMGLEDVKTYIIDCDVEQDKNITREYTPEEKRRKSEKFKYEWDRLPKYRKKGDL